MSYDYLKKVKDLVALTSSSNSAEARTSAFLACKLIREHGFEVIDPSGNQTQGAVVSGKKRTVKTTGFDWVDDIFDDFFVAGENIRVDPLSDKGRDRVVICQSRFPSKCKACKKTIRMGEQIAFFPNRRPAEIYHVSSCSEKATRK
jgi:hypothetical protein